jgi:ATP-dependent Clp protease ATP-binding subunit ClpC
VFERYSEPARRALFFARFAVSTLGGATIATEHLLIGLLRERKGFTNGLFSHAQVDVELLKVEVEQRMAVGERYPTTMEIPFSADTKRILSSAAVEADRLSHNHIGIEHLLLAMLDASETPAAQILVSHGINRDMVLQEIERITRRPDNS